MPPKRITRSDMQGAVPIWLLQVSWAGREFYFASRPVTIDKDDGTTLQYLGGLEMGDWEDTFQRDQEVSDGGSIPVRVIFPNTTIASEHRQGRRLSTATAEVSMVLEGVGGTIGQTYEGRFIQLRGDVVQPQWARPGADPGEATFSVESRPYDDAAPILKPEWTIDSDSWSGHDSSAASGITGAGYPFVFGKPGNSATPASPGYLVATNKVFICVGRVVTSNVLVFDKDGNTYTASVTHQDDGRGQLCAYADISGASSPFIKSEGPYYISWNYLTNVGSTQNPYSDGYLHTATDLLRYLFDLTRLKVDHGAWRAMAAVTDRYLFSGYVNDPRITAWDFIQDEILPLLPLRLKVGPDGIYPVSLLPIRTPQELPQLTVSSETGIEPVSAETEHRTPAEVVNDFTFRYSHHARDNRRTKSIRVKTGRDASGRERCAPAELSYYLYGERKGPAIETAFVSDVPTARQILRWKAREMGFISTQITVAARPLYGWLHAGDPVAVTSTTHSLTSHRCRVLRKAWNQDLVRWIFDLEIESDPVAHDDAA